MTLAIGTRVRAVHGGFTGFVHHVKGGANGTTDHFVVALGALPEGRWFSESEIDVLPSPAPPRLGSRLPLYGTVLSRDDTAGTIETEAEFTLPSNVYRSHWRPAVPAWHAKLWESGS
jgi:hypothetical protein